MKKRIFQFAGILLAMLICAVMLFCFEKHYAYGRIISREANENGISLVVLDEEGRSTAVYADAHTDIFSWIDNVREDDLTSSMGMKVFVCYKGFPRLQSTAEGERIWAYHAAQIQIHEVFMGHTIFVSDGTYADIWKGANDVRYCLSDGTELLCESLPVGLDHVSMTETAVFEDLNEDAQAQIMAYYEQQGVLYDLQTELERAYADYCENKETFEENSRMVGQSIVASAASERVMYFVTDVILPISNSELRQYQIGAAFDRETGEPIDMMQLFSVDESTLIEKILDEARIEDSQTKETYRDAFCTENLIFYTDHLSYQLTAPEQESSIVAINYDGWLKDVLYDWAIPKSEK